MTEIGHELTVVTMGLDAFERARHAGGGLLEREGLVPIYLGADLCPPREYRDWDAIRADLAALDAAVAALPARPRRTFLSDMLRSLHAAVALFSGAALSFADKVRDLVGAPEGPVDPAVLEDLRHRLDRLLTGAGFSRGDLAARVAAWEDARGVAAEALETVFTELLHEAKTRTDAAIFDTGDYTMTLHPARGAHYTARCDFSAARMELNTDLRFTRAALKHLVCHEAFPGHATQLLSTRAAVVDGRTPADALLCTANTVAGCVQEGIGDQAVMLIDWIEDADDAIHATLRTLRSAAQTSAAWQLMVDGMPPQAVADGLRDGAFGQQAWIEGRLRMAAHPFRGPFIASYYAGNESVRLARERADAAGTRSALVKALFSQIHSPASLAECMNYEGSAP